MPDGVLVKALCKMKNKHHPATTKKDNILTILDESTGR
jgi:hypothetical protein